MLRQDRYDLWIQSCSKALLGVLIALTTLSFLNSPGTYDVDGYVQWAKNANAQGIVTGFETNKAGNVTGIVTNNAPYPPLASVILLAALKVTRLFGGEAFIAVKLSVLLFLFFTSIAFWLWTRSFAIAVLLHISLLLSSVALGYIDIFFAPFVILSLWALKEQRLTLFTVLFSVASLIKWQPLIIAPFAVLYILNIRQIAQWKQIEYKRLFWAVAFPVVVILLAAFSIWGTTAVYSAFKAGLSDEFLSGNALNLDWIMTHMLMVLYPNRFGAFNAGEAHYIVTTSLRITFIPKLLFLMFYIMTLVSFFKRDKTFENLIVCSLLGYLAYFTLNTGVHENHLFLAALLSIILFWVNRRYWFSMLMLVLMSNINLLVFYGLDGSGLMFSRVIGGVDIALLLSFLNVVFFLFMWGVNVLQKEDHHLGKRICSVDLPTKLS